MNGGAAGYGPPSMMPYGAGPHGMASCGGPHCGAPPSDGPCPGSCAAFDERYWISAEYLLWRIRGAHTPPLLTSGPLDVVGPSGLPGVLGQPTTTILIGDSPLEYDLSSGGRLKVGGWFDCDHCIGLEAAVLMLDEQHFDRFFNSAATPGTIPISIPYFNLLIGQEDSIAVALPGEFSGAAALALKTDMQSGELNALFTLTNKPVVRVTLLAGYRYFRMEESLDFFTESELLGPEVSDVFQTEDHFRCRNDFHGGQVGARIDFRNRVWSFGFAGRAAYGRMERETLIAGQLLTNDFSGTGEVLAFPGGYFALPSNIGLFRTSRFAVVSEANAHVSWHVYPCLRVFAAYNLLHATHVARPGDQIDRAINTTQAPAISGNPDNTLQGPAAPLFRNRDATWWAQGVSAGLEFRF
jgi:hypothetical protein